MASSKGLETGASTEKHRSTSKRRTGAGGTLSRSETVTVRLDEKLRFLADIAARMQRRTLSSFIEWSIEQTLAREKVVVDSEAGSTSILDLQHSVWDIDEVDRFVKLATELPSLLTYEEQRLWKLVRECPGLWTGPGISDVPFRWDAKKQKPRFADIRAHWSLLRAVAAGDEDPSAMPESITTVKPIGGSMGARE